MNGIMARITRWEHEHILEAVQRRLDEHPEKMRQRRETVEHPFGTIKSWMGSTHFQMKTLKHVGTEMALHVLVLDASGFQQKGARVDQDGRAIVEFEKLRLEFAWKHFEFHARQRTRKRFHFFVCC